MQLKYTCGREKCQNIDLINGLRCFLNEIQCSGKSSFAYALIEEEKKYRTINFVNEAETFESRFEENLWKAHLNFCDEVVPSAIKRSLFIRAVDGGLHQLDRKNQTPYVYDVNTNLIFASNDDISLKQRHVSVVKFGL